MNALVDGRGNLERLRAGEESAWRWLSDAMAPRLLRYFHKHGVERHAAEDLSQETFCAVFRRIADLRDGDRLAAWTLAIARNLVRTRRRRECPVADLEDGDVAAPSGALDPLYDADLQRLVREELRFLSPSERRLLELRVLEGRKPGEAWLLLGVAPEVQRRRLHTALKELRRRVRARWGEAPRARRSDSRGPASRAVKEKA
ncbi:MAG TPA: sigma-70 family RNA polymerase sigma factor [Planctomycetota bacterium]|nr:sigma-70 family RNA polymerase sigma factor [Planctomycetota bacterium]